MLYILYKGNSPELTYKGGQQPIVHLEADFKKVVDWARLNKVRWAFSNGNAAASITKFYNDHSDLIHLNWSAIDSTDFRDSKIKEGKQAEFLMFGFFPWALIDKIGVVDNAIATDVRKALTNVSHQPTIAIEPSWYF